MDARRAQIAVLLPIAIVAACSGSQAPSAAVQARCGQAVREISGLHQMLSNWIDSGEGTTEGLSLIADIADKVDVEDSLTSEDKRLQLYWADMSIFASTLHLFTMGHGSGVEIVDAANTLGDLAPVLEDCSKGGTATIPPMRSPSP